MLLPKVHEWMRGCCSALLITDSRLTKHLLLGGVIGICLTLPEDKYIFVNRAQPIEGITRLSQLGWNVQFPADFDDLGSRIAAILRREESDTRFLLLVTGDCPAALLRAIDLSLLGSEWAADVLKEEEQRQLEALFSVTSM